MSEELQEFRFEVQNGDIWGTLLSPTTGEFIRAEDGVLKVAVYNDDTGKMDLSEFALTHTTFTLLVTGVGQRVTI